MHAWAKKTLRKREFELPIALRTESAASLDFKIEAPENERSFVMKPPVQDLDRQREIGREIGREIEFCSWDWDILAPKLAKLRRGSSGVQHAGSAS